MCVRYIHVINFFLGAAIMNRTLKVVHPMSREEPETIDPENLLQIQIEREEYRKLVGF